MRTAAISIAVSAICAGLTVPAFGDVTGVVELYDAPWGARIDAAFPPETTGASLRVIDADLLNLMGPDSISVLVTTPADSEHVVLRAGIGSMAFNGDLGFDIGGVPNHDDGQLQVERGEVMEVTYFEQSDDFGNARPIRASAIVSAVTGNVSGRWTTDRSPYIVLGVVDVGNLTIDPGVRVRFLEEAGLRVSGSLEINGTATDSVFMEAVECQATLEHRDWPTLELRAGLNTTRFRHVVFDCGYGIEASSPLVMENCAVRNQARTSVRVSAMLTISNTIVEANENGIGAETLQMTECNVRNNQNIGVSLSAGRVMNTLLQNNGRWGIVTRGGQIDYCVITGNGHGGVFACDGNVVVQHNDIFDNGPLKDIRNDCYAEVNAWYNFWGAATTAEMNAGSNPKDITRIDDVYDDSTRGFVNYAHWLTSPVRTGVASRSWGAVKSMFR